ncbi:protein phosphatase 2C domain-containing protein [Rhodococcus aerolatus]
MTLVLRYAARSDRGLVRANNQDAVYAGPRLLALADGMGGHAAGEVASKMVIAALAPLDDDEPRGDLLAQLRQATIAGNDSITELVADEPELEGMGTTLTAVLFAGTRLGLVHVGDSRAYLLRGGELSQITHDDTFVQSLIDEGRLSADEAAVHPQRSLLLRALTGGDVEPTLTVRDCRAGDRYLLCSDGLSGVVSTETLAEALTIADPQASADRLIELALRSGGPDNVTVVVADVVDVEYGEDHPIVGGSASGDVDDAATPDTAAGRAAAVNPARATPQRVEPPADAAPTRGRGRRRRTVLLALVALLVVAAGVVVGRAWINSNYYVGDRSGTVSVLQGLPGEVLGITLQDVTEQGCVTDAGELRLVVPGQASAGCTLLTLDDLRPAAREQVLAGLPGGSVDDAHRQLAQLVEQELLPLCASLAATTSTTATPTTTAPPATLSETPPVPLPGVTAPPPTTTTTPTPTGTDLPVPSPVEGTNCRVGAP